MKYIAYLMLHHWTNKWRIKFIIILAENSQVRLYTENDECGCGPQAVRWAALLCRDGRQLLQKIGHSTSTGSFPGSNRTDDDTTTVHQESRATFVLARNRNFSRRLATESARAFAKKRVEIFIVGTYSSLSYFLTRRKALVFRCRCCPVWKHWKLVY